MVEVNSETDFAAREENFVDFADTVLEAVFSNKRSTDIDALLASGLETIKACTGAERSVKTFGVRRAVMQE